MKKRMSLLLILTMLMSLLPISLPVLATESKIQIVESPLYGGITTGSVIYFGQYTKNDSSKAPIQWRVMGIEDGKATLLSEKILEYRKYDDSAHNYWSGSDICKYLNSKDSYTSNGFLTTAFTTAEQGYIAQEYSTMPSNQKIVLPSVNEVEDGGTWGMDTSTRSSTSTREWWLRSLGYAYSEEACVMPNGYVDRNGTRVSYSLGVRPALKLNLSSVLFTSVQSIDAPAAKTGVVNGISIEGLKSQLPTTVKVNTGSQAFKIEWDLGSYDMSKKDAYTYTFNGKVRPEGIFVLAGGNDLGIFNTTISVTVNAAVSTPGGGSSSGGSYRSSSSPVVADDKPPAAADPISPAAIKKAEEAIHKLSTTQKQEMVKNIEEYLPYTLPEAQSLTIEKLQKLTNNQFTKEELETIAQKPELLKALGVDVASLSVAIVLKPIENPEFKDVAPSHWASDTIKAAAQLGLVAGFPDGIFAPSAPLKSVDTFVFLDRVLLLHNITTSTLPRSTVEKYITDKDHWAFNNMASTASKLSEETLQIISKLGDQPISRELLAQVLYELTKGKLEATRETIAFTDIEDSPYQEAIDYCVSVGLISGMSATTMSPQKALTRAEIMTVLIRLDKMLK